MVNYKSNKEDDTDYIADHTEEQVEMIQAEQIITEQAEAKAEIEAEKLEQDKFDEASNEIRKTLGNTDQDKCRDNVKDVVMFGDDLFKLMSKASSEKEGWMKSTKGMDTGKGCVIQVTTQQRNQDGSYSIAEALTYVQGVTLVDQMGENGDVVIGRRLKGVR